MFAAARWEFTLAELRQGVRGRLRPQHPQQPRALPRGGADLDGGLGQRRLRVLAPALPLEATCSSARCCSGQTFPWIILVTPVFILCARLGLLNNMAGDDLRLRRGQPCRSRSISWSATCARCRESLDEAAIIDGATRFQIMWRIVFPIMLPGIVATATYAFLLCWSEYLFALALLTAGRDEDDAARALPLLRRERHRVGQRHGRRGAHNAAARCCCSCRCRPRWSPGSRPAR